MRGVFERNRERSLETIRTLLEREALAMHDETSPRTAVWAPTAPR